MHTHLPQLDGRYIDCQPIRDKKISTAIPFIFKDGSFIEYRITPERRDILAEIQKLNSQYERAEGNRKHYEDLHKKHFEDRRYTDAETAAASVRRFEKEILFLTSRIEALRQDESEILTTQIEESKKFIADVSKLMFSELETGIDADEKRLSEIAVRPAKKGA